MTASIFDEFLRERAAAHGAERLTGTFLAHRAGRGWHPCRLAGQGVGRKNAAARTKLVIGADGARSNVARAEVPGGDKIPYVIAYHEIIKAPPANDSYNPDRCDVIYDGRISSDFYGWGVFPHGKSCSVGMGTEKPEADLKAATADLRAMSGLSGCETHPPRRRAYSAAPDGPVGQWPRRGAGGRCGGRGCS